MKPVYVYSIIATCFVLFVIFLALIAENPLTFFNLQGFLVVLGGTVMATLISYPYRVIRRAGVAVLTAIRGNPKKNMQNRINLYTETMASLKKGNIHEVEQNIYRIHSPYLEAAAQMIIDGNRIDDVMKVMHWRLERVKSTRKTDAAVLRTMASYAPAFGMLGTLIGLINMLGVLDSGNIEAIGTNMAIALVTTFYGILLSNALFKPLAVKLEQKLQEEIVLLSVAKEAVTLLSQGNPPAYTKEILSKYLEHAHDEVVTAMTEYDKQAPKKNNAPGTDDTKSAAEDNAAQDSSTAHPSHTNNAAYYETDFEQLFAQDNDNDMNDNTAGDWLLSYTDIATLLVTLFVALLAHSTFNMADETQSKPSDDPSVHQIAETDKQPTDVSPDAPIGQDRQIAGQGILFQDSINRRQQDTTERNGCCRDDGQGRLFECAGCLYG